MKKDEYYGVIMPKGEIHFDGKKQPEVKKTQFSNPFKCTVEESISRESLGCGTFKYRKFRGCL